MSSERVSFMTQSNTVLEATPVVSDRGNGYGVEDWSPGFRRGPDAGQPVSLSRHRVSVLM